MTALDELAGHEEEVILEASEEPAFERDFHGPNWLDRRQQSSRYEDRDPVVLIVGGGHAGVTAAARFKALGIDALVVDRMARIGDNWRKRYHGLKLHNQKHSNHFPYLPFPRTWPKYIPKDKIANWIGPTSRPWKSTSGRARLSREPPGTRSRSAGRRELALDVADGVGRTLASAPYRDGDQRQRHAEPAQHPDLDRFAGPVVHSSKFTDGAAWRGKNVCVFGTGTSAHDIAQDLHGNGARTHHPCSAVRP